MSGATELGAAHREPFGKLRRGPVEGPEPIEGRSVLLLPLGDTDEQAVAFVRERYPDARIHVLQRSLLRRSPRAALLRLRDHRCDDFVLFVPYLDHARVRWTKALALLARARCKWLADASGRLEAFDARAYLTREAPRAIWRLAITLSVAGFGPAALAALGLGLSLERGFGLRRVVHADVTQHPTVAFLRTQFWFGLQAGGSVAHTAGVIRGLKEEGARVIAIASDALAGVDAPTMVIRPEVWYDGALRELEEMLFNVRFVREALPMLREARPSALYQRYTALGVAGVLLSRWLAVPLVLEFNSSDVWKARHWGEFRLVPLIRLGEWVNLLGADVIVVVSEVLRQELLAQGIDSRRVLVNPNGVDPRVFHPSVDGTEVRGRYGLSDRLVVGFSGTFGVWHGVPTLAAALPLMASANESLHFLIVGDGPLRPTLDAAVVEHRLQDRITMVGMVAHQAAPRYLAACDILLAPHGRQADGREFFGSPTKLFEYMAMGKAIVASRIGQMADVLQHEQNALLVAPESPSELATAVLRLAADAQLRERLGEAARKGAVERHSWRSNAARVLARLELPCEG